MTLYAHPGDKTVVAIETTGSDDALGRDLAMHVAALAPQFPTRDSVSERRRMLSRAATKARQLA